MIGSVRSRSVVSNPLSQTTMTSLIRRALVFGLLAGVAHAQRSPSKSVRQTPSQPKSSASSDAARRGPLPGSNASPAAAADKTRPARPLIISCEDGCKPVGEGSVLQVLKLRVLIDGPHGRVNVPAAKLTISADTGRAFPSTAFTDADGQVLIHWNGTAVLDQPIAIAIQAESGDTARGSELISLDVTAAPPNEALRIDPPENLGEVRWYANTVLPPPLSFVITPLDGTVNDKFAEGCEAIRVAFHSDFKDKISDSAKDPVNAHFERPGGDGKPGRCLATTRWRTADVPGPQIIDAELVDERPRVEKGRDLLTPHAQVHAVVHSPGHFIVGLGWPAGGRGRNPADTAERAIVPIVGADFSLVPGWHYIPLLTPVLDHVRGMVATRINTPGAESFAGIQLLPLIEGASAERVSLLVGAGYWFGSRGTKHQPYLSISYDATGLLRSALGALGILKAGS